MDTSQTAAISSGLTKLANKASTNNGIPVAKLGEIIMRHTYYVVAIEIVKISILAVLIYGCWWVFNWAKSKGDNKFTINIPTLEESVALPNVVFMVLAGVVAFIVAINLLFTAQDLLARLINPEWMGMSDVVGLFK